MTTFANAFAEEATHSRTENGATCLNTTGSKVLDFFGVCGALRNTEQTRIERLFSDAYAEDKLLATRCLFYSRDVREGLGERKSFRTLLKYAAQHYPECIRPNIDLIGEYGRYDDLYTLIGTPLENDMWVSMKKQFVADLEAMGQNKPVSLLAKWIKTPDGSSKETRRLGIMTALKFGMEVRMFKRLLRGLRKYIDIVETHMSNGTWNEINYEAVPSHAMLRYKAAFPKHDEDRFFEYLKNLTAGTAKINAGTLYPYNLVEKYIGKRWDWNGVTFEEDPIVEGQWKSLPNYVADNSSAIVIADTSGSMAGRPMASAVGLAIYFAERNVGPYKDLWMSFSSSSTLHHLKGQTLAQKLQSINTDDWGGSTNLEAAFEKILKIATEHHVAPEDMPKAIIIISDMEIDEGTRSTHWAFYDSLKERFEEEGYQIPGIVFWNVESRHDTFHVDKDRKGAICCSGQAVSSFKNVMRAITDTPIEMMLNVLNAERYAKITVG